MDLVRELTWKDVLADHVTDKANDGRDYSRTVRTNLEGKFHFDKALPIGRYQFDMNAELTMDDDSQAIDGLLPAATYGRAFSRSTSSQAMLEKSR